MSRMQLYKYCPIVFFLSDKEGAELEFEAEAWLLENEATWGMDKLEKVRFKDDVPSEYLESTPWGTGKFFEDKDITIETVLRLQEIITIGGKNYKLTPVDEE